MADDTFDRADVQTRNDRSLLVDQIYQHCIEPRARLSLPDAVYSYAFIKKMHQLNAPGFITVVMFDKVSSGAAHFASAGGGCC